MVSGYCFRLLVVLAVVLALSLYPDGLTLWRFVALSFTVYHKAMHVWEMPRVGTCVSEMPYQQWAWQKCEATLAARDPVLPQQVDIIEIPTELRGNTSNFAAREKYVCERIFREFGGWNKNKPFAIRHLMDGHEVLQSESWTLDFLAEHAAAREMLMTNMTMYTSDFLECPHVRRKANRKSTVGEVVNQLKSTRGVEDSMYVGFAETFFGDTESHKAPSAEEVAKSEYLRRMSGAPEIWNLCARDDVSGESFRGSSSEMFFGVADGSETTPVGSPAHNAFMPNIFLNVQGQRNWRLWDPSASMFLRTMSQNHAYNTAFGAYDKWALGPEGPLYNLTHSHAPHMKAVPSLVIDMGPGDILYVPPWFLHEARIHSGYSLGFSNRGNPEKSKSLLHLWGYRFVLTPNIDGFIYDLLQAIPFGDMAGKGNVEWSQHRMKI